MAVHSIKFNIFKNILIGKTYFMRTTRRFILGLLLLLTGSLSAQNYSTGIGARLGYDSGLTVKHFLGSETAVEGVLSFSPKHFQITGLYEWQRPLSLVENLDWFIGLGGHLGSIHHNKKEYSNSFLVGIDMIAGVEYLIPTVPLTLGLDWKPTINFTNSYNDYWYAGFALSLRYRF